MIRLYQRLTRNCQTVNQLNSVHIALENKMTPLQVTTLRKQCAAKWTDESHPANKWLEDLYNLYLKSGKEEPEVFTCKRINRHLRLYTSGIGLKQEKTLLICFTGCAQRLMMPIPVFLQHFDSEKVPRVMLKWLPIASQ